MSKGQKEQRAAHSVQINHSHTHTSLYICLKDDDWIPSAPREKPGPCAEEAKCLSLVVAWFGLKSGEGGGGGGGAEREDACKPQRSCRTRTQKSFQCDMIRASTSRWLPIELEAAKCFRWNVRGGRSTSISNLNRPRDPHPFHTHTHTHTHTRTHTHTHTHTRTHTHAHTHTHTHKGWGRAISHRAFHLQNTH